MNTHELTEFRHCEQALKLPGLKQALYDEGAILMDEVLVTLHGDQHFVDDGLLTDDGRLNLRPQLT